MHDELLGSARDIAIAWADAFGVRPKPPPLAQTPRVEHPLEGGARLYRFAHRDRDLERERVDRTRDDIDRTRSGERARNGAPILLVPSLINRWYVLDLRPGASLVEALVGAGFDVWLLDWGVPAAEDRYLDWDAVLRRLGRAARFVARETRSAIAMLGYCMGGTLTSIYAAQHPDTLAALVTLAAPIDFTQAGMLGCMVNPQWFDADAIADAGNVTPSQMQAGFTALRPTLDAAKLVSMPDLVRDPKARDSFLALDEWAGDNIPFPAEAYRRYIRDLYQGNELVAGTHHANGRPARLGAIRCPTLVITASRDAICPPAAATTLLDHVGATDKAVLEVPGGHVGAVVGSRAAREMYPALIRWLAPRLG